MWTELVVKRLLVALVVVFVGFWMVTEPRSLAAFAEDGAGWTWRMLTEIFDAVIRFLGALFD